MTRFSELARRVMDRAGAALARRERGGRGPQPVEMIPGMPAAAEPCTLPAAHWSQELHVNARWIAQPKIDGMGAVYVQHRIVTLSALPLNAALHCLPALVRLEERCCEPMVFHGEYQEREGYEATMSAFKRGEGQGIFWLFDAVPYREWAADRFTQPLGARLARIAALMPADEPFLSWLAPVTVYRPRDVLDLADQAWAAGAEGLVIKRADDPYFRGRSRGWLKLKRDITVDVPVLDVVVPGGDPEKAKALVRLDGKSIWISAMPKHCRELALTDDVQGYDGFGLTGRMVEITYERTDRGTLRGARIVRLRPDKEKPS
jgi:hypothetical protein